MSIYSNVRRELIIPAIQITLKTELNYTKKD